MFQRNMLEFPSTSQSNNRTRAMTLNKIELAEISPRVIFPINRMKVLNRIDDHDTASREGKRRKMRDSFSENSQSPKIAIKLRVRTQTKDDSESFLPSSQSQSI